MTGGWKINPAFVIVDCVLLIGDQLKSVATVEAINAFCGSVPHGGFVAGSNG